MKYSTANFTINLNKKTGIKDTIKALNTIKEFWTTVLEIDEVKSETIETKKAEKRIEESDQVINLVNSNGLDIGPNKKFEDYRRIIHSQSEGLVNAFNKVAEEKEEKHTNPNVILHYVNEAKEPSKALISTVRAFSTNGYN